MLRPEDHITRKKTAAEKVRVKVRDLTPQKEMRGGGAMYPKDPPLPIPPRGFITPSEDPKDE
jgi:hypothetical protein